MKSLKSAEKGTSKGNKKGRELLEIYVHTVKIIQLLKMITEKGFWRQWI